MGIAIFFVYLVPPSLLFLSLSRVVAAAACRDSTWSLVFIYPTITIPVSVWLLIGAPGHRGAGRRLRPARRVPPHRRPAHPPRNRGRGGVRVHPDRERVHLRARVHLPTHEKVISTGVPTELIRGDVFFWQSLQAATVLVAAPIAFVFNLFLERLIAGFAVGAVKG
jgi:multiple sugar transport system permease protein